MAAGTLPQPGTSLGPCADGCEHTDCAETRWIAGSDCPWCGEHIGYERGFYRFPADEKGGEASYAHASCHQKALEKVDAQGQR